MFFFVIQDEDHSSAPEPEKLQGKGGGGEDFEGDLEANASAFEALERDFQDVWFYFFSMFFSFFHDNILSTDMLGID